MANVSSSNGLEKRPKLRFPGFDEPWERKTLSRLSKIVKGEQLPSTDVNPEGLFYHLNGGVNPSSRTDKFNVDANTISISEGGNSCGYVNWNPKPFFSGGHNYTLQEIVEEVSPYFLYEALKSKQTEIMALRVGSGLPNIQKKDIEKFSLYIPSKKEQNHIADFLKLVDSKTEEQSLLIDNLKKYKRGAVRCLLSAKSCPLRNARWTTAKMGELGRFVKGAPLSKADISEDGTPFILYGELYTTYNEVVTSVKRRTQAQVDDTFLSRVGDVVIPTSGETPEEISTASCVMLPDVILAGDLNIFRGDKVDGRIMSYLLNHVVNGKIARIAQGKSVVHIQANELCKLTLTYPDKNTQNTIIGFLSLLDDKIMNEENSLAFLSALKEGLLQQLFI